MGEPSGGSTVTGLSTIALLKVYADRGSDRIDMFRPFVEDAVAAYAEDSFTTEDLRALVKSRHGLEIPLDALKTILSCTGCQRDG